MDESQVIFHGFDGNSAKCWGSLDSAMYML